jgi:hypothetical protein
LITGSFGESAHVPVAPPTPLPIEVFRLNVVALSFVITHAPFALVFTACPAIVTDIPVERAWLPAVVMTMGAAFVEELILPLCRVVT